jgi:2-succinyl-5-enolpyruvyl-6-hydroxy-3-cyclohexene-1-carboxylate synthase
VHVNAHFRKPLEPVDVSGREPWQDEVDRLLALGAPQFKPARRSLDRAAVEGLAKACIGAKRGVIACGPASAPVDGSLCAAAGALSLATGFPILAEATSQVRFGHEVDEVVRCGAFDSLLRAGFPEEPPDLVIELGSTPVSSAYATWVERNASVPRWIIAPHGWHDPFNSASVVVQASPAELATETAAWVAAADDARPREWARQWSAAEAEVWSVVERDWSESHLTEAAIPRVLATGLPHGAYLIVGNSGPVRDLDTYAPPQDRALRVLHQRGASGIDGLVSGAAGVRSVVDAPVVLYLGDVSLLHDLGGLAVARKAGQPLVIVVVQNDGGRIFEQLPLGHRRELASVVDEHFVTPHGLSFEHAAKMFDVRYARAASSTELGRALALGLEHAGCTLIEAVVDPRDGTARRQRLWQALSARYRRRAT